MLHMLIQISSSFPLAASIRNCIWHSPSASKSFATVSYISLPPGAIIHRQELITSVSLSHKRSVFDSRASVHNTYDLENKRIVLSLTRNLNRKEYGERAPFQGLQTRLILRYIPHTWPE